MNVGIVAAATAAQAGERTQCAEFRFQAEAGQLGIRNIHGTGDGGLVDRAANRESHGQRSALKFRSGRKHHADGGQKSFEVAERHALRVQLHIHFGRIAGQVVVAGQMLHGIADLDVALIQDARLRLQRVDRGVVQIHRDR